MASSKKRAKITAEVTELQKQHSEANIKAIYLGWTREAQAESQKRDARISFLRLQLLALNKTK